MTQITIRDEDRKLADALLAGAVFDSDTKRVVGSKDAYTENMPEGLTKEQVKQVREYDKSFIAATGLTTGEIGVERMAADATLESLSSSWDMTQGAKIDWALQRSSTGRNPRTGEETIRQGALSPVFEFSAGKSKNSNLTNVRNHITSLADLKFGK